MSARKKCANGLINAWHISPVFDASLIWICTPHSFSPIAILRVVVAMKIMWCWRHLADATEHLLVAWHILCSGRERLTNFGVEANLESSVALEWTTQTNQLNLSRKKKKEKSPWVPRLITSSCSRRCPLRCISSARKDCRLPGQLRGKDNRRPWGPLLVSLFSAVCFLDSSWLTRRSAIPATTRGAQSSTLNVWFVCLSCPSSAVWKAILGQAAAVGGCLLLLDMMMLVRLHRKAMVVKK